jgi:hypothetical protein
MIWLFQLSVACVAAAALMLPIFRFFIVSPSRARASHRPSKATPR